MRMLLIVGLGGFLGTISRFLIQRYISAVFTVSFPFGTFFINIVGCFLIGIFFALGEKNKLLNPEIRMFLTTGFCGGFTTFSTFSLDTVALLRDAQYVYIFAYLCLSIILGLLATISAIWLIKAIF